MKTITLIGVIACALLAPACAPYSVVTPDGMIELSEGRWSPYDYRATTPEGVVVGARQIRMREDGDVPPADLEFWVNATKLRLRTTAGYALLSEEEIRSADGREGVMLHFGRDQEGGTYRYDIALFVTEKFVHVIEAGGDQELYDAATEAIDEAVASYRMRR